MTHVCTGSKSQLKTCSLDSVWQTWYSTSIEVKPRTNKTGKYHRPCLIATKTSDNLKLKYILEKYLTRMSQVLKLRLSKTGEVQETHS